MKRREDEQVLTGTFYGTDFAMDEIIPPTFSPKIFNLISMGGRGDGKTEETNVIRSAVEACARDGGGTVVIPEGIWLTGPIHLKSGVNLHVDKKATVIFSPVYSDYLPAVFTRWEGTECYNYSPLIYANGCENIAITGEGTLLGNGEAWWHWKKLQQEAANRLVDAEYLGIPVEERKFGRVEDALRPQFIQMINCRNVLIDGVTIRDGPMWTIHPVYCENVIVQNVNVLSNGPNTDGLNPDSCRNVLVQNCCFETGDDCIAINSGMNEDGWRVGKPSENIVIRSCLMKEGHGGVVIGSGISGGVRNVYVHDCAFTGGERGIRLKSMRGRGGYVKNVRFDSIAINDMRNEAIQVNMYYGSSTVIPRTATPSDFRNIRIENITGNGAEVAIELLGLPEHPLVDIYLSDISLEARTGIVCRDVEKLAMHNINITTSGKVQIPYG